VPAGDDGQGENREFLGNRFKGTEAGRWRYRRSVPAFQRGSRMLRSVGGPLAQKPFAQPARGEQFSSWVSLISAGRSP
jgi:hypothetical protein